ncbi:hypothetical protein HOLleu_41458 [Holothuria leucospilota]|uniref:Uncharacterized protein n=1 Tax=Holothuria leucospilota TaxID=206669 RepID=A0A9Q0YDK6_HOLLE|nr:hypothetical protein HOLleu_41458 [Holothuria leucospilota]
MTAQKHFIQVVNGVAVAFLINADADVQSTATEGAASQHDDGNTSDGALKVFQWCVVEYDGSMVWYIQVK